MNSDNLLLKIEKELANHRAFGDNDHINKELKICLQRRLGKIATKIPSAKVLSDQLSKAQQLASYRSIGDPVVRSAIQHALAKVEKGEHYKLHLDECDKIFQSTTQLLQEGSYKNPLAVGLAKIDYIGEKGHYGWFWSEEHDNDIFGRSFHVLRQRIYEQQPCTLTEKEIQAVRKGYKLLTELLPTLSHSALSHAHVIIFYSNTGEWNSRGSSSDIKLSGAICLNRTWVNNPWWVAEHLLHESLHQKLYDLCHSYSISEPNHSKEDAPHVCSLWNEPSADHNWSVHRTLAAFHVYVHLGLFATLCEKRSSELEAVYGKPYDVVGSRTAFDRAYYLGEQLKETCWQELGFAGHCFVDWLWTVLEHLDQTPPPPGSYIHLLLDRYRKETNKAHHILKNSSANVGDNMREQMTELLRLEIRQFYDILSSMGAVKELDQFSLAIKNYPESQYGWHFMAIRNLILNTTLNLSSDGYCINKYTNSHINSDNAVRQMIERSSHQLGTILSVSDFLT